MRGAIGRGGLASLLALAAPAAAGAQGLFPGAAATGGVEATHYAFGDGLGTKSISQIAFPFAVVYPLTGRWSVDLGGSFAWSSVTANDGTSASIASMTDTQVRMSYLFGRDVAIASVMVSLPTGGTRNSAEEFIAASAVAGSFLPFPVHSYGSGTSATGSLALAQPLGAWNVGLAGGVRFNAAYAPFSDAAQPVEYQEGVEGRVRLGVDRLVGQSRLSLGATYSTFTRDQFTGAGGSVVAEYQPGDRWIGEIELEAPVGSGSIAAYLWDYYRSAGADPAVGGSANRENLLALGMAGVWPVGAGGTVQVTPEAEFRSWSPDAGGGWLASAGAGLRVRLSDGLSLVPAIRAGVGRLNPMSGDGVGVFGISTSVFVRGSF